MREPILVDFPMDFEINISTLTTPEMHAAYNVFSRVIGRITIYQALYLLKHLVHKPIYRRVYQKLRDANADNVAFHITTKN